MRATRLVCISGAAALASVLASGGRIAAIAGGPPPATNAMRDDEGAIAANWLQLAFAGQPMPEATEMLVAIARGSRMGPGEGWFHPGQSRYSWKWLANQHGIAPDGAIARESFRGPKTLFDRLDRNHDGILRGDDFDQADASLSVRPGGLVNELFRHVNRSGDGRLTHAEWNRFFDEAARGKDHLTPADLGEAIAGAPSTGKAPPGMPTPQVLIRGLFRGEIGSMHEGPRLDDPAPDFTLRSRDGREVIRLSDHLGKRPIVLTFGNYTCGPFRATYPRVDELARRYKDDALFLAIYVREAHPTDGWRMGSNDAAGVIVAQPRDYAERVAVANICNTKLKMSIPLLVDEIDDRVGHAYSGMPGRLYLIDCEGKIAYKSGRGPFGFKPGELEQALVMLLLDRQYLEMRSPRTPSHAAK
jgi:thiol-disulfide isomerase/thioredoxin